MEVKVKVPRQIWEFLTEKAYPWGFFDKAKQGPQNFYNVGEIVFFF
jgi:hypothetical protein